MRQVGKICASGVVSGGADGSNQTNLFLNQLRRVETFFDEDFTRDPIVHWM